MNFMRGEIAEGRFQAAEARIAIGALAHRGACIAGFRPEDATLATSGGAIPSRVFAVEPLGDSTLVTLACAFGRVVARAPKDARFAIDTPLTIDVPPNRLFFFDPTTEARIRS